jgi:predicted MFS family arabinose efflux permease
VSAGNQMLWLTFAPVTTGAAAYYGVGVGAVGWLAQLFPLLYVVLALPAGRLLDRSLPGWLGAGAALTAGGAVLRLLGDSFTVALAGQLLVAVAQPLVLNAVTAVSRRHLRPADRATGIAVSSAGIFAGMVLAFATGAAFGDRHLSALLWVQAGLAVAAALGLAVTLAPRRGQPGRRAGRRGTSAAGQDGSGSPDPSAGPRAVALRDLWADSYLRLLVALVLVGFGVFVALTTWLQALLEPAGVGETQAGVFLLLMVVAGVLGSALVAPRVAERSAEPAFLGLSVVIAALGCLLLAVVPGPVTALVVLVVLGALLLTDLPLILGLAERRAGAGAATATGLLWLAGNLGGLVLALVVQALVHHPAAAFGAMALTLVAALPFVRRLASLTPS